MMFRTEFAVDGVWYTNALRFADTAAALHEAQSRFSRWWVPQAWRVVTTDVPEKQIYLGAEDQTAFKVTDAQEQEVQSWLSQ